MDVSNIMFDLPIEPNWKKLASAHYSEANIAFHELKNYTKEAYCKNRQLKKIPSFILLYYLALNNEPNILSRVLAKKVLSSISQDLTLASNGNEKFSVCNPACPSVLLSDRWPENKKNYLKHIKLLASIERKH